MAETRVLAPLLELVERAEGKAILVGDPRSCRPSAPAASTPPSASGSARSSSSTTAASTTRSNAKRSTSCATATPSPTSLTPPAAAASRSTTSRPSPSSGCSRTGGRPPSTTSTDGDARLPPRRRPRPQRRRAHTHAPRRTARPDAVEFGGREFRVGDRVLCRQNDARLGVRNGTRATIVDLDARDAHAADRRRRARARSIERYAAEHLEHGYALTGHAAQGATFERAYVLLPDQGALHEWGYVACTRARTETRLYLADRDARAGDPLRDPDPPHPPERAARALERSAAEPLALDQTTRRHDANARMLTRRQEELEQQRARQPNDSHRAARAQAARLVEPPRPTLPARGEIASRQLLSEAIDKKRAELARTPPTAARLLCPVVTATSSHRRGRCGRSHRFGEHSNLNRRAADSSCDSRVRSRPIAARASRSPRGQSSLRNSSRPTPDASTIALSVPLARSRSVHRHDHAVPMVRMAGDVVASPDSIELPAAALQRTHRLARRHRR